MDLFIILGDRVDRSIVFGVQVDLSIDFYVQQHLSIVYNIQVDSSIVFDVQVDLFIKELRGLEYVKHILGVSLSLRRERRWSYLSCTP